MNDTMSLVLATAILAVGGLGLYMYKSSDEFAFDDYNEDDQSVDDLSDSDQSIDDVSVDDMSIDDISVDDNYDEPKSKGRNKTKRNKKNGGTKKRY